MSVPDNQICWTYGIQLSEVEAKEQQFRNSEWSPEQNEVMLQQVRNLSCPWGGRMADIVDATPKHLISKVFLEEKVFMTWYHGRTVLIGDACHKVLPTTGLGAANAFQDAVVLANCISNMKDWTQKSITGSFKEYYKQRFRRVNEQFEGSHMMARTMIGQSWSERMVRYAVLHCMPKCMQERNVDRRMEYRPQIAWLPLVEKRGAGHVQPQEGKRRVIG
ncbi:hypothetical protein BGZ65_007299 [Modicella reniformis]|uniref:FAD-binding domain-containing protein n=1 Tax=Modicella reniformis TaxID=1440133 RepID=A0A9P6JH49_9FUNG|nr:hypothetical protein BGZ65_007299 [Modicella reniformis]